MNDLVLFIDCDGTLKTEHDDVGPYEVPSITVQSGTKTYVFAARPHLHEFLDEAAKKASRIVLCTAGGGGYARRVIKAMNIDSYFTDIVAAENFMNRNGLQMRAGWKCIFIDNDQEMVDLKVERIKGGLTINKCYDINTWVIDTYHGSKDDTTLLEVMEEIKKL